MIRHFSLCSVLTLLAFLACGHAAAQNQSMDCTTTPQTRVTLAEGDQNSPRHLQVTRELLPGAHIDLDVCNADLIVKGGLNELLRLTVDLGSNTPAFLPGDYLQVLDTVSQTAAIKLHLPKSPRAKVVITVPASVRNLRLNLVRGDLSFETDRIHGDRKVNVVSGHLEVLANADAYSSFHSSVLMGSFHDHRKGGENAYGMVSKDLPGTGRGTLDVNVVKGSIDLRAWD
jgi:hypothetical protein